jgi:ubiquinone/menaquinone biosynthesis C-methylase UbiE
MNGFESTSYGDAFADVYDDWYANVSDVDSTVAFLAHLAGQTHSFAVLELGVGTGRLAMPLAAAIAKQSVIGIDSSEKMLAVLTAKDHQGSVTAILGDMVADLPDTALGLVFVAYNTLFSLTSAGNQQACFSEVAKRLVAGGHFVIEAFVPDDHPQTGDHIEVRTMTRDSVVLSVSRSHPDLTIDGQFIQFTEAGGIRLRPWQILPSTPEQLDEMAAIAGLELVQRMESFAGTAFSTQSTRHVSVYRARS